MHIHFGPGCYKPLSLCLGTFTTIEVNYEVLPGQLCITCMFLDRATNFSCLCVITAEEKMNEIISIMIPQTDELNTQCKNNFLTGVYQLIVYDIDDKGNVSLVPAFVYHKISIMAVGWSAKNAACF